MGRGQSDFEIRCGWSLGALGRKFLIKGLEKGPPSHLFFRFHLKARGGKRRREKSHRLGRGGGSGRAGAEAAYSHPYPPNFPGRGWGGVWVWVLRKERYPLPTPPAPAACPPKPESGPRASRRRCLGRVLLGPTGGRARARNSFENPRHRRNRRNWLQLVKMPGICTLLCDLKQK